MRKVILSLTILLAMNCIASSAEISIVNFKDGKSRIDLNGDIGPGDSEKLKNIIQAANDANRVVATIRLNSKGGNIVEGVSLATSSKREEFKRLCLADLSVRLHVS